MTEEDKIILFPAVLEVEIDCGNAHMQHSEADFLEEKVIEAVEELGMEVEDIETHY